MDCDFVAVFPSEVTFSVFEFLDYRTLCTGAMRVSRAWRKAAADDLLWRSLYLARWRRRCTASDDEEATAAPPPIVEPATWRWSYAVRTLIEADVAGGVRLRTAKDYRRLADHVAALVTSPPPLAPGSSLCGGLSDAVCSVVAGLAERKKVGDALFAVGCECYATANSFDPEDALILYKHGQMLTSEAVHRMETPGNEASVDELFREAYARFTRVTPPSKDLMVTWGLALYNHANMFIDDDFEAAERLLVQSVDRYTEADALAQATEAQTLNGMGDSMECLSQLKVDHREIDHWFGLAIEKYRSAVELEPTNGAVVNNWGLAHHNHAFTKTGLPAIRLLEIAVEKYHQALLLDSEKYVILYNMGDALSQMAHLSKDPAESDRLFREASAEYQRSYDLKTSYYFTPNNWGWSLYEQASRKTGPEFEEFLAAAMRQFERALDIKPNYHVSIANRGNVWLERACRYNAAECFEKALENYRLALRLKPRFYKANHYIGLHNLERARRLPASDPARVALLHETLVCCNESLRIKPNYHPCVFTAAQAAALLSDWELCRRWVALYNVITGALEDVANGAIALHVSTFAKYCQDLSFNFKTYFWRFV
jgi:tetratricopeptide (TPR) repeat protein